MKTYYIGIILGASEHLTLIQSVNTELGQSQSLNECL